MGRVPALPHFGGAPTAMPPTVPIHALRQTRNAASVAFLLVAAWLLANLPLLWAGAALAAAGAALILLRYPWLAWPGLAVSLPFASGIQVGPLSLADGILAAALSLWFINGVRRNRLRLKMGILPAMVAIYLLALLLSFPNAINLQKAIEGVIKWTQMLLIVLLVQEAVSPRQLRWLVWGLLAAAALQAAVGVYQFVFRIGPPGFLLFDRFMRASGTFGQPNPYAGYLGLTLPVAAALFLHELSFSLKHSRPKRRRALTVAAIYACLTATIGLGLLASWSRGAWLGAGASLATIIFFQGGRKIVGVALAAFLPLLVAGGLLARFIPASLTDRFSDLPSYLGLGMWEAVRQPVTSSNFSVIERLAHWIAALRMWDLSPWLGVGPGNYAAVYPQVRLLRWEEPLGHAHNIYLNVLAENGLIGFLAYLAMWLGTVLWLLRTRRKIERRTHAGGGPAGALNSGPTIASFSPAWNGTVLLGVVGVIVHLSVHHLFDFLYVQGIYLHIALWLGTAVALASRTSSQ